MPACVMIPKIPNRVAAISINIMVDYRFGIFSHVHSDGFWLTDTSSKGDFSHPGPVSRWVYRRKSGKTRYLHNAGKMRSCQ